MKEITLKQAIADLPPTGWEPVYDVEDFFQPLGLSYQYIQCDAVESRLKEQYLIKWYCTDSYVGVLVFQLDGIPVAITRQEGRKCGVDVMFLNAAGADAMRAFLLSLMEEEDDYHPHILPDDEMIEDHYTVEFGDQLLTETGIYNGEPVTVVKKWHAYADIDKWRFVEVKLPDGTIKEISMDDFMIPLGT